MLKRLAPLLWSGLGECVQLLASAFVKAFIAFAIIMLVLTTSRAGDLKVSFKHPENLKQASRIFADGFESGGPGNEVPPDFCADSLVNPAGFYRTDKTWTQTFSAPDGHPSVIYPASVSFPTPVGAEVSHFRVVPFTPNVTQTVNLYWDQVQARPQDSYPRARPARSMFMGITPCNQIFGFIVLGSGDLRPPVQNALDPFQRPGCREIENAASIVWTTDPKVAATSDDYVCVLEPGKTYWLIVAALDPRDGLEYGEETCELEGASGCDVGVRTQASTSAKDARNWIARKAFGLPPVSYKTP